jgi:hypothetical protein
MSVYVDELMPCVPSAKWKYLESCHMIADAEWELHSLAKKIGLRRDWFQRDSVTMPHYDLTKNKRVLAIRVGAIPISREDFMRKMHMGEKEKIKVTRVEFFDGTIFYSKDKKDNQQWVKSLIEKKRKEFLVKPTEERTKLTKAGKKLVQTISILMTEEDYSKIPLIDIVERGADNGEEEKFKKQTKTKRRNEVVKE